MKNEIPHTLHRHIPAVGNSGVKCVKHDKNVLLTNCSTCGIMIEKMAKAIKYGRDAVKLGKEIQIWVRK